jgi:hypothetical protein
MKHDTIGFDEIKA